MVSVAQLVEPRVVIPVVVGSSPIVHPILRNKKSYPKQDSISESLQDRLTV